MKHQYSRAVSIAPMMRYTDRHFRYLMRLITPHSWLYTEMVTTGALLHGDVHRFLQYDNCEHPLALQLGGSEPHALGQCVRLAKEYGYDEVNLNVGCPSDRVQSGGIGACLMKTPTRVAECYAAMAEASDLPITIKTRLGVDDHDSYPLLHDFVKTISAAGCEIFIFHARKAWLSGLNPKENRSVPPLRYDWVYQLKKDFPALTVILNGGIKTRDDIATHLQYVDGVMIGRAVCDDPLFLLGIDELPPFPSRTDILNAYTDYVQRQAALGEPIWPMVRHLLGLFKGVPGAKEIRGRIAACRSLDALREIAVSG